MSINPVPAIGPASEVPASEIPPRAQQPKSDPLSESAKKPETRPDTGTVSKQDSSFARTAPIPSEFPEDEVQLQQDPEIKDQVIIKYLDKANGEVVLQVPSAQVLAVDRGIRAEFQKQAETATEGTKPRP